MRTRSRLAGAFAAGVIAAAIAPPLVTSAQASSIPTYDHVFVIVMENHSYIEIVGSSSAPYINRLLSSGAVAANYYAVAHPSLPNYLALTAGSGFGIASDCTTCWISANNIGDTLEAAGSTWKAYMESMPSACFISDSYPYAQKHNPFVYFNDIRTNAARCQAHDVPYSQLAIDLHSAATTPNYAFITPNMCDDMHDCSVGTGDGWLQAQVPAILSSPAFTTQRSLLAITWDEDDYSSTNQVATILIGSNVLAGASSFQAYSHWSLLATVEAARGLPPLTSADAGAAVMADMLNTQAPPPSAAPCSGIYVSASPASPSTRGTPVTITAGATGCSSPEYEFWTLARGGSWAIVQPYSAAATFIWNTAALAAGTYRYSVWARDANRIGSYDTYFPGTPYTLTTTQCTGATATPTPAAPQLAGSAITITATAAGCPTPLYEFWIMPPVGGWTITQAYSSASSFRWNTTPPAGTYLYSVWVRDMSSAAAYDAYFPGTAYALTTTPCTGVTATTQASGATATITASASGCPNPRYEFWILAPGGSWTITQPYSSASSFNWNISGLAAGAYRYSVWVRDASSGASYDTYFPGSAYAVT